MQILKLYFSLLLEKHANFSIRFDKLVFCYAIACTASMRVTLLDCFDLSYEAFTKTGNSHKEKNVCEPPLFIKYPVALR